MKELLPLQKSHTANQVEAEFNQLVVSLFNQLLYDTVHDCNVMGLPFEGSYDLVTKQLINANIAKFDTSRISDENMRYLLLAWKYRNGKRGTHFLKTFIKCTWGNDFQIDQLWQNKNEEYPLDLRTQDEITISGLSQDDFYLTSRLRISLTQDEAKEFPLDIVKMLRNTLPARLFIAEIMRSVSCSASFYVTPDSTAYSVTNLTGAGQIDEIEMSHALPFKSDGTAYSVASFIADNIN